MEDAEKEFSIFKKTNELVIKRHNNVKLGDTCLIIKRNKESIPSFFESFNSKINKGRT